MTVGGGNEGKSEWVWQFSGREGRMAGVSSCRNGEVGQRRGRVETKGSGKESDGVFMDSRWEK